MFSLDQYHAARRSAVVIDRSTRGTLVLTGADRATFLHALLTNDIAQLKPGAGVYSAYLTPQGRMIADMRVVELGDRLLVDVEAFVAADLAGRLDGLIFSEDVQVRDATRELGEIGVYGPEAATHVERVTGLAADALTRQYDNLTNSAYTVVRDDGIGVQGYDIYLNAQNADGLRSRLLENGVVDASPETFETLRIEAGRPRFGVDMSTDTIPLEAGIEDRAISMTKGCYVGQEVIIRVLHRGHGRIARRLVGLVMEDGAPVVAGDTVLSGVADVGMVTSATQSPLMSAPIALAYVQRDHTETGARVSVKTGGGLVPARVTQLPFTPR